MEKLEAEKGYPSTEDSSQLNRNRSFKSKQLVRSQAIRESASPPRSDSPVVLDVQADKVEAAHESREISSQYDAVTCVDKKGEESRKQPVEIQITAGNWDECLEQKFTGRQYRAAHRTANYLSNSVRVACVCGQCNCNCRTRQRRQQCPTKQDSGIVCSDDCPDCSDTGQTGASSFDGLKSESLDSEDQSCSCRCPERKEKPKNISLSRTESEEKFEPTGVDIVNFIKETLNKNARDRLTLLKIEKELHSLVNDPGRCVVRFPVMTSYGGMLVHRCASLFQLSHHLDHASKTAVTVSKSGTSGGRIPCTSFKDWCTTTFPPSPQRHQSDSMHAKSILKRDTQSLEESGANIRSNDRSRSLEQREKDYERVRRRIFSNENSQDDSQWPWLNSGPVKLLTPESGKNKLLKVQSLESEGSGSNRSRGAVAKSRSFGDCADPPRLLSRQGDLASSSWRLSPSSSGYKTLSLRSTDSVTPSPTEGASPEPGGVVWCVSALSAVPRGAALLHPKTGRPLTNPDGSIYHYDPNNPPVIYDNNYLVNDQEQNDSSEKKRGRLEKQNSFIDNECECQPVVENKSKCCCDCSKSESYHKDALEAPPPAPIVTHEQSSPCKNRNIEQYQPNNPAVTQTPAQKTTNQKTYESPAQKEAAYPVPQRNYEAPNPRQQLEAPTNQKTVNENSSNLTNQRMVYESQRFEARPQSYENVYGQNTYETVNYRQDDILANQRLMQSKMANQEQEMQNYVQQLNYVYPYRNDEVTSPPQLMQIPGYMQPDMQVLQQKITPVPMADPNIRPMSLNNVVYAPVPHGYPYINHCRIDQIPQPLYQPVLPTEEHKAIASLPPTQDTTFRIDPSYPYPAMDYSQCGACVATCPDPNTIPPQPHRSYNVQYGQMEMPPAPMPQTYPVANVMMPQPIQPYPMQLVPGAQWAGPRLVLQELCPRAGGLLHAQMIPQPYPICQPVYPIIDKPELQRRNSIQRLPKRNSISSSARNTPATPCEERIIEKQPEIYPNLSRQNSNEIAVKIQQIKEQMAQLNTREKDRDRVKGREEWRRRSSGNGILGSYPANNGLNGRVMGRSVNDEAQLTTAARAIVNSIRHMHTKNTYQNERRQDQNPNNRQDRRRPERDDREKSQVNPVDQSTSSPRLNAEMRDRRPMQYRPQYLVRQVSSPGTWFRRSPGDIQQAINHPRRQHPDPKNQRR